MNTSRINKKLDINQHNILIQQLIKINIERQECIANLKR